MALKPTTSKNINTATSRKVKSVKWRDHLKEIFFSKHESILLPRSACVSDGDQVIMKGRRAWVRCQNGDSQIAPTYVGKEELRIGNLNLELVIKEITEPEEFKAYEAMAEFHYRGHALFGRTARLIVRNFHPIYPKVVGYVELATPFYMNKARSRILDAPFLGNNLAWERWDMATMRRYINIIVRIARCVIYPEFRGLGLGQLLVKHSAQFAKKRWQVGGLKPCFLEISADMLKFVPFAKKAGMQFIGETEGNLKRVAEDMEYLLKNRKRVTGREIVKEESCGIVDQQVARMNRAAELMKEQGWTRKQLQNKLERLSAKSVLRDFNLFHDIVSLPKPTYLQGLDSKAEDFLSARIAETKPRNGILPPVFELPAIKEPISFENVSLVYRSNIRRTLKTHAIQQAFGISPEQFEHTVIRNLTVSITPGDVVLITGPSGSGKTTLLRLLAEQNGQNLSGKVRWPQNYSPGMFQTIRSDKAMIELLGGRDVRVALHLMGLVGLSDAFIYLKRFSELSNGQQYRAMLAQLIASQCNVWLADEFCSNLDVITSNVVADRLQKTARQLGAVLIVATSNPEPFATALRPNVIVRLTTTWDHSIMRASEFFREIYNHSVDFEASSFQAPAAVIKQIRQGQQAILIKPGHIAVAKGPSFLTANGETELATIAEVRHTQVGEFSLANAQTNGLSSIVPLQQRLFRKLPHLCSGSCITLISLSPFCSKHNPNGKHMA